MSDPATRRPYHSPKRQQQAEQTRRQILEAARRLFAGRGYTATTLPAIAREAGVSAPTVTAVFGTKPALLQALIGLTVRGDAGGEPLVQRSQWQEMLAEPDPGDVLRRFAALGRRIHERSADVFDIMRSAASEPEIAEMLRAQAARRLDDVRSLAEALARKDALSDMNPKRAADIIWVLGSAGNYRLLTAERGWTPDEYEVWLASSLINSVLDIHQTP